MPAKALTDAEKKIRGVHSSARSLVGGRRRIPIDGKQLSSEPPKGISGEAQELWAGILENAPRGLLGVLDVGIFERYCRTYAQWRKIMKVVEHSSPVAETETGAKPSPEFQAAMALSGELIKLEKELGFTPLARARLPAAEEPKKNEDKFDGF